MRMRDWVRLPSRWIEDGGLQELHWTKSGASGSDNAAALMVLAPIAHVADDDGVATCTYDRLTLATGLLGHRMGRRRVLLGASALMLATGLGFLGVTAFWPLLVVAVAGVGAGEPTDSADSARARNSFAEASIKVSLSVVCSRYAARPRARAG